MPPEKRAFQPYKPSDNSQTRYDAGKGALRLYETGEPSGQPLGREAMGQNLAAQRAEEMRAQGNAHAQEIAHMKGWHNADAVFHPDEINSNGLTQKERFALEVRHLTEKQKNQINQTDDKYRFQAKFEATGGYSPADKWSGIDRHKYLELLTGVKQEMERQNPGLIKD